MTRAELERLQKRVTRGRTSFTPAIVHARGKTVLSIRLSLDPEPYKEASLKASAPRMMGGFRG